MKLLNVLIIEDTIVYRKILHQVVLNTDLVAIVHTAPSGEKAIELLEQNTYDIAITDIFMPGISGLELLDYIKEKHADTLVVVISGGGEDSAQLTIESLDRGALDFIIKPQEDTREGNMRFLKTKISQLFTELLINKTIQSGTRLDSREQVERRESLKPFKEGKYQQADVIVVAASTGGPVALRTLLQNLGVAPQVPVLIVQHMPANFTKALAQSFTKELGYPVLEAEDKQFVSKGKILLARGGYHMQVVNTSTLESFIQLDQGEVIHGVRPSADVLFKSVAHAYQNRNVVAIVMTGMGKDGMEGVRELKKHCHCYCYTQDEATCIVYGMPRSVVQANLSDESFGIHTVPKSMIRFWKKE